jgi:hypothetical protein
MRGKSLRRIKDIATVDLERHKLNCQDELNQKQKVIQSEYDILFEKLRSANKQEMASMGEKEKVLQQVRTTKDKIKELKRQLAEANDSFADTEMGRLRQTEEMSILQRRVKIEEPAKDTVLIIKKLEDELASREREL